MRKQISYKKIIFCVPIIMILLILGSFVYLISDAVAEKTQFEINREIEKITDDIDAQKDKITQLQKRIANYQKNIIEYREKEKNLTNEIVVIDLKMKEKESEIEKISAEIQKMNLEIQNVTLHILEKELVIQEKKEKIIVFLKKLDKLSRRDILDTLILYDNFSDFYNELKEVEDIQWAIQQNLDNLKISKQNLINNKNFLEETNIEQVLLSKKLFNEHEVLVDQQSFKTALIRQTQQSEDKYQSLLASAKAEQLAVDAEIVQLDTLVREKIKELESIGRTDQIFAWPVDSSRCCTTYYYDKSYPYRHLFEHAAIDVPASQGTKIKATKDGYVARIRSPQAVGKGYAYIMLIHEDGFSSVYGHISCVLVNEDALVKQGDEIACVGGSPGTQGAGALTTGSHLHFEIRKDGVPVNPLKYLP